MTTPRRRLPDEVKRRKEMRKKFRLMVRMVMFNRIWLADAEEQKLSLNVKKNIAMLFRTQQKIGILTVAEKSIIRTLHAFRSIEDRKKLVTLVAGLPCFQTLPPKVRARLVPVIKYMLVKSGRTIIREGCEPHMIFFILSGEVEVTNKIFDHISQTYVEKLQYILGPGDYIGDVALLENTLRKATCIVRADTELLVLNDEDDFDRILRPVMSVQWENKKRALGCLEYFNFFTEAQMLTACKLGHLKQFDPLETIYHEDKGAVTYVHFIISGECMILQCLKMKTRLHKKKRKSFELVEITKEDMDEIFKNKSKQELMEILIQENRSENTMLSQGSQTTQQSVRKHRKNEMDPAYLLKSIEIRCGLKKKSSRRVISRSGSFHPSQGTNYDDDIEEQEEEAIFEEEEEEEEEQFENKYEDNALNNLEETLNKIKTSGQETILRKKSIRSIMKKQFKTRAYVGEEQEEGDEEESTSFSSSSDNKSSSDPSSMFDEKVVREDQDVKLENRFIDVGSMTFGGIFGLGEKLEHRVIMARTTVQCLMLPRFWLLEKEQNPGNIWQRRRFYLDCTIPSRQSLFKDFITTRKWQAFKTEFIQSNLQDIIGNPTKTQDIPIICRIVEANDE